MSEHRKKRRATIYDPEVQGNVIRKITMHWIIFFSCNVLALLIWVRLYEQPDTNWEQTFSDTFRRFLPFFVVTLVLLPAFIWDTLKLTNRFAGPMLRLSEALVEAGKGHTVPPLRFRDNDFWQEIASNFNMMMEHRENACETTSVAEPTDQ